MIRVLHLTVGLGRGGAERLLVEVLPHLPALGIEPSVAVLKRSGPLASSLAAAGIRVHVLGGLGQFDPRPLSRLKELLRDHPPELVHAHLRLAVLAAYWCAGRAGIPYIAHFHSLAPRAGWGARLERVACRAAAARVAVSSAVARDRARALDLPEGAFTVIHNGIDTAPLERLPKPALDPGRPLVAGFLGRLRVEEKGLDVLLEAMRLLGERGPAGAIRLEICGGPAEEGLRLERRAARLGIAPLVELLPEDREVAASLARWDVVVLPSRREGFGLALLEGMAAGRPVVASRVGGIPELVEDEASGLLVTPGDAPALAAALARLAEDVSLRRRLGEGARARARHFQATSTATGFAALARHCLEIASPRAARRPA